MITKTCKKCRRKKELSLFYIHKWMADGHLNICKSCVKKRVKQYYLDTFEKRQKYEKIRNQRPERKEQKHRYQRQHRAIFKGKTKATATVARAIKDGRLIKQPCEVCGLLKVEAHHTDYRSYLKVRWLCRFHHRQVEKGIIKLNEKKLI